MDLIVDIGNSYIKLGVFNNNKISSFAAIKNNKKIDLSIYKKYKFNNVIISSVVKSLTDEVIKEIKKISKAKIVNIDNLKKNLKIKVDEPIEKIGGDLIADLYASRKLYKSPSIIFDIGTVSKVLALDKNNTFIGASFFPGLEMMSKSLNNDTDALPFVKLIYTKKVIAKNTKDCISSGVIHSLKYAIEGFIEDYQKEMKCKCSVVFTGGGSSIFKKTFKQYKFNDKLTLLGISYIYKENK